MRTLKFNGYGDDTFGEYGVTGQDYDNCASGKPIQCVVDCGEHGRVMVVGQYNDTSMDSGCWLIGMTKVDEYDELPEWNYRIEKSDCEYSPALLMDIPEVTFALMWYSDENKADSK